MQEMSVIKIPFLSRPFLRRIYFLSIVLLLLNGHDLPALAAVQGTSGATSTGTVGVSVPMGDFVRISAIDDIDFGEYSGSGNLVNVDDICIYSNTAGGGYNVTANGSGAGGAFQLSNGSDTINYTARWNDVAGTNSGQVTLAANVILTGQTGASTASTDCFGGTNLNARVRINISSGQLNNSSEGGTSYTGTFTIVIAPE